MNAALSLLDSGRPPSEVSVAEMCRLLGVVEESFYGHFRDVGEFHAAVAAHWLGDRIAGLPGPAAGIVRDPVDRIRMIRAALAGTAARDAAVRRWAATDPAAAAAAAEAARVLTSHLKAALTDLGLADRESAALADWLAAALQVEAKALDREGFETLLAVWARAAAIPSEAPAVEAVPGAEPGQTVYFAAPPRGLTTDEQAALNQIARLFAAGRAAEQQLPGQDREETGQAREETDER